MERRVGMQDRRLLICDDEPAFGRLGLKATRDRLDNLLDEAGRRDLSLREALSLVCAAGRGLLIEVDEELTLLPDSGPVGFSVMRR